ncbi:MAG: sn-glycerol-3-phosphate ABC transporter ATP-binding protein UgpC [Bacilli bacterium]|nr:sn-glycerol-3-phosphate ABC transporter ATP-binding protein UgpC [Bacilli bacterium]
MADVTLRHVYKVYDGGVRAVNDFDLSIKDKEFVVFVGPSGCGKSTTLRMIAGLEDITAGQLYIDGELMNEVEPKNRDIAMVFQSYALYPHMTVYENMAFGLKLRHVPKEEIDERVKAAAEILEISDLLSRKPKALSGGQRQRVALGRTIVRDPKVFLLDEPLSNLDAKLRVSMRSEITKLHERLGTTFIYVTHDQTEAMTMGNRIVVMKDGFIQQADTPISLFEDPCNLFVATFLGSPQMNIVEAELFMDDNKLKARLNECNDMIVTFPDIKAKQLASQKYITQKVLLGIRPEHVRPNQGNLHAFIDVVEHLGDESILYTKMDNRKDPFIIKIPFNSSIHSNTNINIELDMDHVYLFDVDTKKAIMGIPHEDEIPALIENNVLSIGEQSLCLDEEYLSRLLDGAFNQRVFLAIKPEYITFENIPNSLSMRVKLEFIEQKTDYQALYFSIKGLPGFFAMKIKNGEEIVLGKEAEIFLPYHRINIYDANHNKLNSREVVHPNQVVASVTNKNGSMIVKIGKIALTYPEDPNYPDGDYLLTFFQDMMMPIFPKKMLKNGYDNPEMIDPRNKIKVSAYDEDVLGDKLLVYVAVDGFENYCSFVVKNNFSVYKLPKFDLYVPREAFGLEPVGNEE